VYFYGERITPTLLGGEFALLKRQVVVPSVPYIRQKVIDGGRMNGKVSIFWSGFQPPMDGYHTAKDYGKQMFGCDRAVLYDEALPSEDYKYFASVDEDNPPTSKQDMQKIQVMSAVFAQTTTGTAYVLLQDGKQFSPSSTWTLYEYPNLTAGISTVTEIILIYWPSLTQESLWKKGKGQQGVWPPVGADRSIFAG
jgi:hypothetical protein